MKRVLFALSFLVLFVGCAQLKEAKTNINACYSDPVCFAEAVNKATVSSNRASDIAGLSGLPWATKAAKPLVGYSVLIFTLAVLGKKKRQVTA